MMQWNPIDKKTAAKWGAKSRVREENAFVLGRFVAGRRRIRWCPYTLMIRELSAEGEGDDSVTSTSQG